MKIALDFSHAILARGASESLEMATTLSEVYVIPFLTEQAKPDHGFGERPLQAQGVDDGMRHRLRRPHDDTEAALANFALTFAKALLVTCVVLFLLISPETKREDGIKPKMEFMIAIEWPGELDYDVDIWIKDPDGKKLYYERRELTSSPSNATISVTTTTPSSSTARRSTPRPTRNWWRSAASSRASTSSTSTSSCGRSVPAGAGGRPVRGEAAHGQAQPGRPARLPGLGHPLQGLAGGSRLPLHPHE